MSSRPGFYAVPGSAWPGNTQPGRAGTLAFSRPAVMVTLGVPYTAGGAMGFSSLGMSHLATMYYLVPVAATQAGVAYNPTGDTVQFAFAATPAYVPQVTDWVGGSWDTNAASVLYPYSAKCLVGPSGTVTLGIGTYVVYVKIFDNPETPVLIAGQLEIS